MPVPQAPITQKIVRVGRKNVANEDLNCRHDSMSNSNFGIGGIQVLQGTHNE